MASSHNLKNPNGDPEHSPQDKSIEVRLPDGRDEKMQQHIPQQEQQPLSDPILLQELKKYEVPPITKAYMDRQYGTESVGLVGNAIKYDFDDIVIKPKSQTNIESRFKDVNPYVKNDYGFEQLPIMTAPMDSVVGHDNAYIFQLERINVVLPRTANKRGVLTACFNSYGFKDYPVDPNVHPYVLLDVANGHMGRVLEWCTVLKKKYPNVKIMAGNIANPDTYRTYCASGVIDYARIGIGNGNGCLTTQQTGVGYPMASLIAECYKIKIHHKNPVKIVADGGMKDYADIIKALALGADYVMVGSLLSKSLESSAPCYWKGIRLNQTLAAKMYKMGFKIKKEFRGMSTKGAQKALGNTNIKTSEGVVRRLDVEYTLEQWVENFTHYLRSAMSYSNANNLSNFIGQADYTIISNNAFNRFKK